MCMLVRVSACVSLCVHASASVCEGFRVLVLCVRPCVQVCARVRMYVHVCACARMCMHVCVRVFACVCMHELVCVFALVCVCV